MNGEHITRPEFDIYVKMTAESMSLIAASTKESAKESREINQILREYIITNNNKHEKTSGHIIEIKEDQKLIKEVVDANSRVTSIANKIIWGVGIVLAGALGAFGKDMVGWLLK